MPWKASESFQRLSTWERGVLLGEWLVQFGEGCEQHLEEGLTQPAAASWKAGPAWLRVGEHGEGQLRVAALVEHEVAGALCCGIRVLDWIPQ